MPGGALHSIYRSGNYGGPLGACSLAQGVLGNKSLRVLLKTLDILLTFNVFIMQDTV